MTTPTSDTPKTLGRPRKAPETKLLSHNIYLSPAEWSAIDAARGRERRQDWIRRQLQVAVERAREGAG